MSTIERQRSLRVVYLNRIATRFKIYWSMIKDLQTGLLLFTALAGYISGLSGQLDTGQTLSMLGSLFLAISGCTVLNMVIDRDIDACMARTSARPLAVNSLPWQEALALGVVLTAGGIGWALRLSFLYGMLVFAGALCNTIVYSLWLKRRTPYAILFGGIAGGIPIMAGRSLSIGAVDPIGVLLLIAILLWIPSHIMTFTIKYQQDYRNAGIPTFVQAYGPTITRAIIAGSSVAMLLALSAAAWLAGMALQWQAALLVIGLVMSAASVIAIFRQNATLNFLLYKGASIYMLLAMLIFIAG